MNKNFHRVIFNAARGLRVAVQETARSVGKGASRPTAGVAAGLFGTLVLASSASAQIVADPNAPGNQRPTVLAAPNGAPLVNIQAPSAAGVSRNTYKQFDVDGKGAILNNSPHNVQTQTGGWVQGNPWLGRGPARIILNEVNSANPSLLRGFVEVAGQKAEVIIANPAGIQVNGGGFINATGVTLTTGTPQFSSAGSLESFLVRGGMISIDGAGLDASQADYAAILSRALQVNAGIWAKELKVVAGANKVSANAVDVTPVAGNGAAPTFALDVAQLGGMYANKIVLVGTEAGVGVRNAGSIGAGAGELIVTSAGRLENRGTMEAARLQLASASEVDNSGGTIRQIGRNTLTISAPALSNRDGGVIGAEPVAAPSPGGSTAAGGAGDTGTPTDSGTGGVGNSGGTGGTGGTTESGLAGQGGETDSTSTAAAPLPPGQIAAATGVLNDGGRIYVGGDITLQTPQIDNSRGTLSVNELNVSGPRFANAGGTLNVRDRFSANVGEFDNTGGTLQAGQLEVDTSGRVVNRGGTLRGASEVSIAAGEQIDNNAGRIESGGNVALRSAARIDNASGRIEAMGALAIDAGQGIDNTAGALTANQGTFITGQSLGNAGGRIQSAQADVRLSVRDQFDNASGNINAGTDLVVNAGGLGIGGGGTLRADRDASIDLGNELISEGSLQAGRHLEIRAASIRAAESSEFGAGADASGTVGDAGDLRLQTTEDLALHGTAIAAGSMTLEGDALDLSNSTARASSAQMTARQGGIDTRAAQISSVGAMMLRTQEQGTLDNRAGLLSAGTMDVSVGSIDNRFGGRIEQTGEGPANIAVASTLENTGGNIASAGGLQIDAGDDIDNSQGSIASREALRISSASLRNEKGSVASVGDGVAVHTQGGIDNSAGSIQASKTVELYGEGIANDSGLVAAGAVTIDAKSGALNNAGGRIVGQDDAGTGAVGLAGQSLSNAGGLIGAQRSVEAYSAGEMDNRDGQILSGDALSLRASTLDNTAGLIRASGAVQVDGQRVVNSNTVAGSGMAAFVTSEGISVNAGTGIEGSQVRIATETLSNDNGAIRANEGVTVVARALVDNANGRIEAGRSIDLRDASSDSGRTLAVQNAAGSIVANRQVAVDAASLAGDGVIRAGEQLGIVLTQDLNNTGRLTSAGDLSVSTTGRLTNSGDMTAWGDLTVVAQDLDNTVTGEISGARTTIKVPGALTNRGLIDGDATRIETGELTNIGTGRIYGGQVSIAAKALNNLSETVDGHTQAAAIAARGRLDIGAITLNNKDGALIYSDGDMAIGGALDANGQATGSALNLSNHAASIESAGNMRIDTIELSNTNGGVSWTMTPGGSDRVVEYAVPGDGTRYPVDQVLFSKVNIFGYGGWATFQSKDASNPMSPGDDSNIVLLIPAKEYPIDRFRRYYLQSPRHSSDLAYDEVVNVGDEPEVEKRTAPGAWYPRNDAIWSDFGVAPPPVDVPASHPGWIDPNIVVGQAGWTRIVNTESGSYEDVVPFDHPVTQEEYDQWQAYRQAHGQLDVALKRFIDTITGNNWDLPGAKPHFFGTYDAFDYTVSSSTPVLNTSAPARIVAGGTMDINLISGRNEMSDILAGDKLTVRGGTIANDPVTVDGTRETNGTAIHSYVATHTFSDDERRYDTVGMQESQPFSVTLGAGRVEGNQNVNADRDVANKVGTAGPSQAQGAGGVQGGKPVAPIMEVPTPVANGELGASSSNRAIVVRTSAPDTSPPTASLFRQVPDTTHLIETDPRFANYRQWLSSDYLLGMMGAAPNTTLKRLGDGYYEQRLINEQVAKLTGYRYLDGFDNDEAQYKALMTSGATFAQKFNLTPGIALTAEQMAQLTSDIVWLVEQTVTLPDGSTQRVLVPQLYVRVKPGDIDGTGSLLSGREVQMALSGDVTNRGIIAGRELVKIDAQNINNIDGGLITGRQARLDAKNDINNIGATVRAQDQLSLHAGNDINIASTVRQGQGSSGTEQSGSELRSQYIDRVAGLYVTNPGGSLTAKAENDINLTGAKVRSEGTVAMEAGHDLNLKAQEVSQSESVRWNAGNSRSTTWTSETGSSITAKGDVALKAGNDVNARAARVSSTEGDLDVNAGRDINIVAGESRTSFQGQLQQIDKSLVGKSTLTQNSTSEETNAIASSFGGANVIFDAKRDITIRGSNVVSDKDTELWAERDITIEAATEHYSHSSQTSKTKSGLFVSGTGVTVGRQQQGQSDREEGTRVAPSTVGAISGDVYITADGKYRQTGSDVSAATGDVDIQARSVEITEARETRSEQHEQTFSQSGVSVGMKAPLLNSMMSIDSTARATQEVDDERMKALGAASVAAKGYSTYQAATSGQSGLGFSLSVGKSEFESTQSSSSNVGRGSSVQAGNDVRIQATGGGADSNVLIRGSQIDAGNDASVRADNRIDIVAADNTQQQSSNSKGSHASVGLTYGVSQSAAGLTLDVAYGQDQGSDSGQTTTHTGSSISAGSTLTLESGGDTTIRGSVVSGKRVEADIGGKLRIETLQDTSSYQNQQEGGGFDASVCLYYCSGGGFKANGHDFGGTGNYASATEQSGIRAGDGGFSVDAKGGTELIGASITSTQKAVDEKRNSFTSPTLVLKDLDNSANFSADGKSLSVGTSIGDYSAGIGQESEAKQSTTKSGISGIAGDTEVRTGKDSTNALTPIDQDKVMRQVGAQVEITRSASEVVIQMGPQAVKLLAEAVERLMQPTQPDLASMPPAQRRAQVREAFETVLSSPNLTPEQRSALMTAQQIYERAEDAKRDSYDRAPSEGDGDGLKVVLPLPMAVPPVAAGSPPTNSTDNPAGNGAPGYDPQTDTYQAGSPPLEFPSLDNLGPVPPSVQIIYGLISTIMTMSADNGTRDGSLGTETSSTPPKYVPSPKHDLVGGWGTPMDLSDSEAQEVLEKSSQVGKQRYGFRDGKLYEFQPDNVGGWHGYPIPGNEAPPSVLRDLRRNGWITAADYNRMRRGK